MAGMRKSDGFVGMAVQIMVGAILNNNLCHFSVRRNKITNESLIHAAEGIKVRIVWNKEQ